MTKQTHSRRMRLRSRAASNGFRAAVCAGALIGLLASASPTAAMTAMRHGDNVVLDAAPGETNNVVITYSNMQLGGTSDIAIDIADDAVVVPSWWCQQNILQPALVMCPLGEFGLVDVRLLDGNDRYSMVAFERSVVDGGPGNDDLVGGSAHDDLSGSEGSDTLDGGAGLDYLSGGPGVDVADYSARTAGVTVTLNTLPSDLMWWNPASFFGDDGVAGERDHVFRDIEHVFGGRGDDELYGSAAANELRGGPQGNDLLKGFGGGDRLIGYAGDDRISGGAGKDLLVGYSENDQFSATDGERDQVYCGTGIDTVAADPLIDYIAPDCEFFVAEFGWD